MSDRRQKIRPRLAFGEESKGEAPKAPGQGSETPTAKRMNESPANNDEQLMEVVCERGNYRERSTKYRFPDLVVI